ncbi:hypothetical protein OPQ81_003575 [Rhizoctonia solani]|nr:hypothetical protein OPQ81_003575 [Rhizoctonia solani]
MKSRIIISLVLLTQLGPSLGAALGVPEHDGFLNSAHKRVVKENGSDKLGVKMRRYTPTQGLKNIPGMIPKRHSPELAIRSPERESDLDAEYAPSRKFDGIIQTCSERDCKRNVFMKEALRWVKQALKGVGVVIDEHPIATTALIIGVSILLAEVISGGMLVTAAFDLIGFGAKGHIKGKVAAAFQSKVTKIQVGSLFSQLQSAAMNGATVMHLQNMAKTLVHMLIGLGAAQLASEGIKTIGQSSILDPLEWRTWESESRIEAPSNASVQVFWKAPESEGCVSYGYRTNI